MKRFLILIFSLFVLASCSTDSIEVTNKSSSEIINETNHEYSEINDKKICWNDMFFPVKTSYFVYFYSLTCSHCKELKNKIIEYGLSHDDIYFCEDSEDTKIGEKTDDTIGIKSSELMFIKGFPSLIKIEEQICVLNIAGVENITSQLFF